MGWLGDARLIKLKTILKIWPFQKWLIRGSHFGAWTWTHPDRAWSVISCKPIQIISHNFIVNNLYNSVFLPYSQRYGLTFNLSVNSINGSITNSTFMTLPIIGYILITMLELNYANLTLVMLMV